MNPPTNMARRSSSARRRSLTMPILWKSTISFHKDVEFIIASISKRRNEALRLLDLYRAGLGKQVERR